MKTKNNLISFLLAILLIFLSSVSSAQVYKYNAGNLTDSASQLTWKKYTRFLNQNIFFGDNGDFTINLSLYSDIGKFIIKKTDGTQLLVFDEDNGYWDFKFPLSLNGVPFTTGGGDAFLAGANHFTTSNTFDDSVIAGTGYFERFNAWDVINMSGNIISDLNFTKGSLAKIGSIWADSISLITHNQNRLIIDTAGNVNIGKTLTVNDLFTVNDIYLADGRYLYLGDYTSYPTMGIRGQINEIDFNANNYVWKNLYDDNVLTLDSSIGLTLLYGHYMGNGNGLTTLNASNLSSGTVDTARLDSKVTTSDRVQTLTNKTISATANTISNLTTGWINIMALSFNPVDLGTYYFSNIAAAPANNVDSIFMLPIPYGCTIDAIALNISVRGTLADTNSVSVAIGVNGVSYTTLTTTEQLTTVNNLISVTGLNISISAGSWIEMRMITPTWPTNNPTSVCISGNIHIK